MLDAYTCRLGGN